LKQDVGDSNSLTVGGFVHYKFGFNKIETIGSANNIRFNLGSFQKISGCILLFYFSYSYKLVEKFDSHPHAYYLNIVVAEIRYFLFKNLFIKF